MTPLRHKTYETNALSEILKIVPEGSVVDSYMFFSGQLEMTLSKYNRFVCAHTTQYVIYEFWLCLFQDPEKIYDIIKSQHFKFNEKEFPFLQDTWAKYKDQYIRSAIFYFLNKCSPDGTISYGTMQKDKFTNADLAALKTFKKPKNFFLLFDPVSLIDSFAASRGEYQIVNAGKFSNNFFEDGKSYGLEETKFEHLSLLEYFEKTNEKTILLYKNNPMLIKNYQKINSTIKFINKYGNPTTQKNAHEVIIANF